MKRKQFNEMNCSIARSLDEIGEWWSLLIVRECTQGTTRFDELQTNLGIARNILTARLSRLIDLSIIERYPLPDRANTDGYRLTKKGEELYPVLVALMQWGDKWVMPGGLARVVLLADMTGEPIQPITVHAADQRSLSFREVRFSAGPGAGPETAGAVELRNRKVLGKA